MKLNPLLLMVKLTMDQVEEIKSKVDIVDLISEYITLKKSGRNFKANCPFHGEKTPSFMVSPQLQIFKCFGCGESGDVIKFLELYERMEFVEALEFLAKRVGVTLKRTRQSGNELIKRKILEVNNEAAKLYHFILTKHPVGKNALQYITNRGITGKSLETFQVGFSPLNPEGLTRYLVDKKKFNPSEVIQSGLAIASSYNPGKVIDRFRGRIIFPLRDHRENIVGFSGRLVPGMIKNENQTGKYINTPETAAYHKSSNLYGLWLSKDEIKKKNQTIVVEGELDLISSWQIGIKNIVAIKGTAFTEDQTKIIKRFSDQIILALDEDFAGNNASLRSVQLAEKEGLEISAIDLKGKFKDPDEAAQGKPQFLIKAIEKAVPVWDFVIKTISKKYDQTTIAGKKKILSEALPFLSGIENEVVKSHYLRKLAQALAVDTESVLIEAEKTYQKQFYTPQASSPTASQPSTPRREVLETYLLGLIFSTSDPKKYLTEENKKLFKSHRWTRIFSLGKEFFYKKKYDPGKFLALLPEELKPKFAELFFTQDQEEPEKEIDQVALELKKLAIKESLNDLSIKITKAEKEGGQKSIEALEKEFARKASKLVELSHNE